MANDVFKVDLIKDSTLQTTNAILAAMAAGSGPSGLQPKSYADVLSIVRLGLAPAVFSIGDIIEVERETSISATMGQHTGITAVSVDEDKFVQAMHEAGNKEYEFTFDGSAWIYDGEAVILNTYGITAIGTPAKDDTILIIETASKINMVVMDFIENGELGALRIKDKTKKYGMLMQSEKLINILQYDQVKAFYAASETLTPGTYNVTFGDGYDTAYGGGKTYQFTLTKEIPVGGQIYLPWAYQKLPTDSKVSTYANNYSTDAIESNVVVTEGSEGTSLGTILIRAADNLNSIHRMRYGSNKWSECAIRQQLNSGNKAGLAWEPQNKFDRPPAWASGTAGFMKGLDPEFIKICCDVEVDTVLNTVCDTTSAEAAAGTGYETTVDKFFLPSRSEVFGGKETASDKGVAWEYYKANSDNSSETTAVDSNRIKVRESGSPYYWWLRSPLASYADYVRLVYPPGYINGNYACNAYGVAPACIIA